MINLGRDRSNWVGAARLTVSPFLQAHKKNAMKKRLLSVLAFALAVSAGAAFVLYQLIASKVRASAPPPTPTTKVFVASHDLELGALIEDKDIRIQQFLSPPTGAITKKEDVIGRGVTNPIHEDTPFFDASLAPMGAGAGFAATIPTGMRAFAIHVNDVVGVAGFAVAGMRVDVLVSGTPPGAGGMNESAGAISRTFCKMFRFSLPARTIRRTQKANRSWYR